MRSVNGHVLAFHNGTPVKGLGRVDDKPGKVGELGLVGQCDN